MLPLYIGTSERPLFGVYESPDPRRKVRGGVLICPPVWHEHIRAYRALRNLAVQLSDSGFHVLRFDYFGSGDSSGGSDEMTVSDCLASICSALDELKDISGLQKVRVMGLRFGATLGARAVGDRKDVEALTVWDPVVSGAEYLADLDALQVEWLAMRPQLRRARLGTPPSEVFGFPVPAGLRQEIASLNLATVDLRRVGSVSVIMSIRDPRTVAWADRLRNSGTEASLKEAPGGGEWDRPEAVHSALIIPPDQMRQLVATACGEPA
jgi:pimeloyl-ACP methyl ester carboxylesterase